MSNRSTMNFAPRYTMETPGESLVFRGDSVAARWTCFFVEALKIMLDCGIPSDFMPRVICITHMHLDHFSEIERYLLSTENSQTDPLIIICPAGSVSALRDRIGATFRATKGISVEKPVPFPPHVIIGATVGRGDNIIIDLAKTSDVIGCESTTFRFTEADRIAAKATFKTKVRKIRPSRKSSCCGDESVEYCADASLLAAPISAPLEVEQITESPAVEPADTEAIFKRRLSEMRKPCKIEAIRCNHGGMPTTGYGFSECRERIKSEYLTTDANGKRVCIFSNEEMGKRKASGTLGDMKETVDVPMFAYICDTDHMVFSSDGKNEGHKLEKYPVIIIECTFYAPADKKKAKNDKHMHWDNLALYIAAHPDKYFKLIHHSQRYNSHDMDEIQRKISVQFPTPPRDTPHVVLCRNDNAAPSETPAKRVQKSVSGKTTSDMGGVVTDVKDIMQKLQQSGRSIEEIRALVNTLNC